MPFRPLVLSAFLCHAVRMNPAVALALFAAFVLLLIARLWRSSAPLRRALPYIKRPSLLTLARCAFTGCCVSPSREAWW